MMPSVENHRRQLLAAGIHRTEQYFTDYERRFRKASGNPPATDTGCAGTICRLIHEPCEHYHGCSDQCRFTDDLIKPQIRDLETCPK